MKNRIAFILNYPSHYREFIYKKIEDELKADFYFGDIPNSTIKKIDYNNLNNFKKELKTVKISSFFWYQGILKIFFKPYKSYVLTGDPHILSNWLILILAKLFRKKVYLWTHGWYGREKGIKKIIKINYFKLANKLFLYGHYSKDLLIKEGFSDEKLIVIYNSLDYESQLKIRKNLSKSNVYVDYFKNKLPVIIFIGRLNQEKKIEVLVELVKMTKINLVLVGKFSNNKYEKLIIDKINTLSVNKNIWLYGESYNEEINAELIFNANVCISPGDIGLTAIHSLMFGTSVITHNNFTKHGPEFETIIEGKTGSFFIEDKIEDLLDKLNSLLLNPVSIEDCYRIVDYKWNPNNQIKILKKEFNEINN